ncbi:unnamed protein product [marine sediment metagenome]|uniref:Uncharacterized protein n=1 Tax=marine sediment metagenome TaxID=412755 RepID=X1MC69_9ZZZZ
MSEFYKNLEGLKRVTQTNLPKQFENVQDFCTSSIHFANRCNMNLALKDLVLAEMAAHRLREDAERRFIDGLITKVEYIEISDRSLSLIAHELPDEVTTALAKSCECAKVVP